MTSSDLRIGIVGAGFMAREHIRAFQAVGEVQVCGIFSRTPARARQLAEEFGIAHVCSSVEELRTVARCDAVVVTVPELSAESVSMECFGHPWYIMLEKPAGHTMEIAGRLRRASHDAGARTFVALNRRHYSSTRQALELLPKEGVRTILIQDQQDMQVALGAGQPAEVVRNWMFANSIHVIDYFRVFGRGEVLDVSPTVPWDPATPGTVIATVTMSSGDVGVYVGIWDGPGPWAVAVTSSAVRVEMRPLETLVMQKRGERKLLPVDIDARDSDLKAGLYEQALQFKQAARGLQHTLPTIEDAFGSMQLCARIFGML
ncbi:MAG TPA: Gfo/Idh/MocA family oxidoreductase [Steroidobacter sp.]